MSDEQAAFYFLPSASFGMISDEWLKQDLEKISEETSITVSGFKIAGRLFGSVPELPHLLKEKHGFEETRVMTANGQLVILAPMSAVISTVMPSDYFSDNQHVMESITEVLMDLSAWSGLEISFGFYADPCVKVFSATSRQLNVVIGAMPPGEFTMLSSAYLCGVRLHPKGNEVQRCGPTVGRGYVVTDLDRRAVAQVLGRTIYLLLPTHGFGTTHELGGEEGTLFVQALRLAWSKFEDPPKGPPVPIERPRHFEIGMRAMNTAATVGTSVRLNQIEKELSSTLARYRALLNEQRAKTALLQTLREDASRFFKNAPRDWKRIRAMPEFAGMTLVDGGIHVLTNTLVSEEWGGVRYDFGAFTIRFGADKVSIWTDAPTHPAGVPHPHISLDGGAPCFGNVGPLVEEAAAEGRYADALELIFGWLKSGYDPALSLVKIEEWPAAQAAAETHMEPA